MQYSARYIKSIICNIIYKFLPLKHAIVQYMLARQKLGNGGEEVVGNSGDGTAQKMQRDFQTLIYGGMNVIVVNNAV